MAGMPPSPNKHEEIKVVSGTPADIIARGGDITALGDAMFDAADVLQDIKERALEDGTQKGKAIEALRDSIGDSYETLREAAGLYRPVGRVITQYGEDLQLVRNRMDSCVDTCDRKWTRYVSLPGEKDPNPLVPVEEGSPEDLDNQAKQDAYDEWVKAAEAWEDEYDRWDEAFDDAVRDIGNEMSGEIKDGWWENWGSDFFEALNTILNIAGLVLFVACLVVSGPLLAVLTVIAVVVAVASLVVVAVRFAHDEASGLDLALAIVGVIPFGKAAKVLAPADEVVDAGVTATRSTRVADGMLRAMHGQRLDELTTLMRGMESLDMGRQLAISQLMIGSQLQHLGGAYQGIETIVKAPKDVPDLVDYLN